LISKIVVSSIATIAVGGIAWFAAGKNHQTTAFAGLVAFAASFALNK